MYIKREVPRKVADIFTPANNGRIPTPAFASTKEIVFGMLSIILGIALIVVTLIVVMDILTGDFTAGSVGYMVLAFTFTLGTIVALKLSGSGDR